MSKQLPYVTSTLIKKKNCLALIAIPILCILSWPSRVKGQDSIASRACDDAITYVEMDIENRLGGTIREINASEDRKSPYQAKTVITFTLPVQNWDGTWNFKNESIISSHTLLKAYSQRIIDDCQPVVSVVFSDNWETFSGWSLHPTESGNTVLQDRCIPYGRESLFQNRWGYKRCV